MTKRSRSGLRIHAELDAFLVSQWQGPVDSPAHFVQRVTAIRGERGEILSHGGCWHGAKSTMRAFAGATLLEKSFVTRGRQPAKMRWVTPATGGRSLCS